MTSIPLTANQKKMVDAFLLEFLPPRGNRRKYPANEIDYIQTSLNKVFSKWFAFHVSRQDLLDAFIRLGYQVFTKKGDWVQEQKKFKPVRNGEYIRYNEGYISNDAMYIYIDVEAPVVRQLLLTTMSLVSTANADKVRLTEDLKRRIALLQKTVS